MKKWRTGFLLALICICYGLTTLYSAYVALPNTKRLHGQPKKIIAHRTEQRYDTFDIWDTCGIGVYLWRNILHGEIARYNLNNGWIQSSLVVDDMVIRYNLGYGMTPKNALIPSQPNIVLVINARDTALVPGAKFWLDHVLNSAYIDQIAVMILGSESCDNTWIQPYLLQKKIKFVFLIYDSPLVDDDLVFQWPLGVASYRNFLDFDQEFLDLTARRQYNFNFIGTVYPETSRVKMMNAVDHISNKTVKYIKTRKSWVAEEDSESMANYRHVLLSSDLTLCPVGRNSECYRTYEAMELGSMPVIEDVLTEGTCDYNSENQTFSSPYRLLKQYNPPVHFVKDWEAELPAIVKKYRDMSHDAKVRSRINLIRWYVDFKEALRRKFLHVVKSKFFTN